MRPRFLFFAAILMSLCGCQNGDEPLDKLGDLKKAFIHAVFDLEVGDGPFDFKYSLKTVFFSKDVVSLFGKFDEYTHLPHGRVNYEGKTFCKLNGRFKEITLDELFTTNEQKEFLRSYCEKDLKSQKASYFFGENASCAKLEHRDIRTFVIDDHGLIVIFQPYVGGGYADGPFFVKIPYEHCKHRWNTTNRLSSVFDQVIASKSFIATWD
jgi:hypothetical protein